MRDKKKSKDDKTSEQEELVRRVDSMMSTELPDSAAPKLKIITDKPADQEPADEKPAASAPKQQKTAPELSPELLKDTKGKADKDKKTDKAPEAEAIKVTKLETPAKPPIVISLADESQEESPEEPAEAAKPEPDETDETDEAAKPVPAPAKDPLEDKATDKAVDDIVAHEGDTVLAVNDALTARKQATAQPGEPSGVRRSHKWFWIIILIVILGTAADAAVFMLRH